jgi:hypothetical protein
MPDIRWDIRGMSLSCLNDIGTYMTHILGYIMFHIHIYTSINISFCVATVSNRPSGLDSIVLSQSSLVLDDPSLLSSIFYSHN